MPVQTLFGRPIPRITARRIPQLLALIAIFAVITLVFTLPSAIPVGPSLSGITQTASRIPLPKIPSTASKLNPFRPTAHAPAIQENSTSGDSSWYSNWNWLSPFSSSVTLDERRSLLPPLPDRPPIYIYYDHTVKKDADLQSAEHDILLTWRKAWWAQGFRPIILGPAEAMRNPLYEEVQRLRLEDGLQHELSRWLAWENMGDGILCHHLTLPMGAWEDPLLSYLRRGEYPKLTRYDGLSSGIFSGSKADVTAAVKLAIGSSDLAKATDMIEALPQETFTLDSAPESVAYYDEATIKAKYIKIAEKIRAARPAGLLLLNQLINSHLHNTWQNIYSSGIAVLKPLRTHMTAVVEPALDMAQILAQCPESPMLSSCPPNRPKCRPCVSSSPMKVATPPMYRNTSTLYTIGTVPHPYTLTVLTAFRDAIDIPFIRRQTSRDSWLTEATKESLGTGVSSSLRLIKFKEAVASPYGKAHSLWFTAERATPLDLSWHFGFSIPKNATIHDGRSEPPVPGPERRPAPAIDLLDGAPPPVDELERERTLLAMAKEVRISKRPEDVKLREAVEAWNLADMEAWRFARAFLARSSFERSKWEDEEKKFAGGAGAERAEREGWGRWFD